MAPESEIAAIETRRLAELEKQAALYGPQTEPAVLIEIADLRNKYGRTTPSTTIAERRSNAASDYEFLMNTVAAALQRLTVIEQLVLGERDKRPLHQAINMAWMLIITFLLLYELFGR
jgi:hypothetical protein